MNPAKSSIDKAGASTELPAKAAAIDKANEVPRTEGLGANKMPTKEPATKLKLQIAHQVPGRVRMKIPAAKGNPQLLQQIGETFGVIPGIDRVTINTTTGSIVLRYDTGRHREFQSAFDDRYRSAADHRPPATEIDILAQKIQDEAGYLAQNSTAARAVVDFFKDCDHQIKRATANTVDLKIVLALGVIGVTVFEMGVGAATPVWLTLLIFGLNHAIEMHRSQQEPAPVVAPVVFKTA
jgi:hypothetical protein